MAHRLSGFWFKVRDVGGGYLGILLVSEDVAERIIASKRGSYVRCPKRPVFRMVDIMDIDGGRDAMTVTYFDIVVGAGSDDSISLLGITPEEVSLEPEFAFLPGPRS